MVMIADDDLDDIDRDALTRAMAVAMHDAETAQALNDQLAGSEFVRAQPWLKVATTAAYHCQIASLHLKPWEEPPVHCDEDATDERDKDGKALLRRMLENGLSRYEPHPLRALDKSAKRIARLRKKKPKRVVSISEREN
jgi:hypothetical protein